MVGDMNLEERISTKFGYDAKLAERPQPVSSLDGLQWDMNLLFIAL
jgi:hypothetical protein